MSEKIEDTIKLLVEEGRQKGFLTFTEMSKLLEDQFLPPDRMDQVFVALEDAGIDVIEGEATPSALDAKDASDSRPVAPGTQDSSTTELARGCCRRRSTTRCACT